MKSLILALLLVSTPQWAQEKPPGRMLITLKYASPSALERLVHTYNVSMNYNEEMKVVTLSGPSDAVDAAAAMIRQLDVPPKDIDLTVYYLIGSDGEGTIGSAPPKDLDAVVAQLKGTFAFKTYRLLDVMLLRTRVGQRVSSNANLGMITTSNGNILPISGALTLRSATVAPDGSMVRIDEFRDQLRWPVGSQYSDLSLNTDVDLKEGQKVVIGRLGISHDQALFVILNTKVVN